MAAKPEVLPLDLVQEFAPALLRLGPGDVNSLLNVAGITNQAHCNCLIDEVFPNVALIGNYNEDDLREIVKDYKNRTVANGKIIISRVKERKLLGMICWIKDAYRCNLDPVVEDLNKEQIQIVNQRADIRKQMIAQADTVAKAAAPKNLKGKKDWYNGQESLKNYLSLLQGSNGVPLDYVIRTDINLIGPEMETYKQRVCAYAPLHGEYFDADDRRVHQIIKTFVAGESAEEWIRHLQRHQSRRRDITALRNHF